MRKEITEEEWKIIEDFRRKTERDRAFNEGLEAAIGVVSSANRHNFDSDADAIRSLRRGKV